MNEVEQQAADTVISRMEFLERVLVVAEGHWNMIEYKVPPDTEDALRNHAALGELLKQNREADDVPE